MPERPASLSPVALRLAAHVGQAALALAATRGAGVIAKLDQHVAALRTELGACQRPPSGRTGQAEASCPQAPFADNALYTEPAVPHELLLHYACGFVQAALHDGWQPTASADAGDWASLRLAAVCKLIAQGQAAARRHPDLPASA